MQQRLPNGISHRFRWPTFPPPSKKPSPSLSVTKEFNFHSTTCCHRNVHQQPGATRPGHTHTRKHPPETVSVGLITSACRCRHRGTLCPGKATISGHRVRGTQILPSNSHLLPTHTRTLRCGRKFNCILHVHGEAGRIIG